MWTVAKDLTREWFRVIFPKVEPQYVRRLDEPEAVVGDESASNKGPLKANGIWCRPGTIPGHPQMF